MSSDVEALQAVLAAEHAVVWGYGVVGGKVGEALLPAVREADGVHRTRRDLLLPEIRKLGADPVPTEASYDLPFPVTDQRSAVKLAVHLEEGAARAWRYAVVAADAAAIRRSAVGALTDAAVRATGWRLRLPGTPATEAFPGR